MQTLPKLNAPFNLEARSMPMRTLNKNTLEKMEEYIQRYCIEKGVSPSYRKIVVKKRNTLLQTITHQL